MSIAASAHVSSSALGSGVVSSALDSHVVVPNAAVPASNVPASNSSASVAPIESDPRILKLYELAKQWTKTRTVSAASVITFVTYLISATESLIKDTGQGQYKKAAVLTVLRAVVENDIPFQTQEDKDAVLAILTLVVPVFIDTAIGLATGQIDIGKIFVSCSPCCMGGKTSAAVLPAGAPPVP